MPEHDSDTYRAALAALDRVRELHTPVPNSTSALHPAPLCSCGGQWPCPTIRALDGTDE